MARISISYSVPVQVIVDLDERTVDQVVIVDIQQDRGGYAGDADTFESVTPAQIAAAYDIAESEEWPSWKYGF